MGENFCILHFKSFQEKLIPIPNICHLVFCFLEWTIDPSTSASLKLNDVLLLFITAVVCYQKNKIIITLETLFICFLTEKIHLSNSSVRIKVSNDISTFLVRMTLLMPTLLQ